MLRASGKIGIANCVLPSLNKDITYLLTYLLTNTALSLQIQNLNYSEIEI